MGKKIMRNVPATLDSLPSLLDGEVAIDPFLSSLFERSIGPVNPPSIRYGDVTVSDARGVEDDEEGEVDDGSQDPRRESESDSHDIELESQSEGNDTNSDEEMQDASNGDLSEGGTSSPQETFIPESKGRKRKRVIADDNLEEAYLQRLAKDELKAEKQRIGKGKKQKVTESECESDRPGSEDNVSDQNDHSPRLLHETITKDSETVELDKSSRTVFIGNVSNRAIKSKSARKTLLSHLASFLSSLPQTHGPHQVESIRFRSTAYSAKLGIPRRAAFAKKELMDSTTLSTNAYVVYSTAHAARRAPEALNGTLVLDRHLRVDCIAHPGPIDHKRCIFVGNLDFVDRETILDVEDGSTKQRKRQATVPADIEEGLWRTFNTHTGQSERKSSGRGSVESVRVVRDPATRVGKGFAYVQFYDPNCVEEALLLDGKKFPPLLPRKLRVTRARGVYKKRSPAPGSGANAQGLGGGRQTLHGRAQKLLGKAGATKLKSSDHRDKSSNGLVFEGYRATQTADGRSVPRFKVKPKSRGAKGKPKTRSTRRAAAFRAGGSKRDSKSQSRGP
ncbi:hypothetical protein Egran_03831 [Elaphomyces granulatus]|uniref:Nucleolar protein 12 n=1 Tax=Elaphomyces granulatus TaxID=519963 RepID=A0A232LW76_9EURO|nr:hypothetical protein Egran_03831 [Elaphomyces granulatus]